MTLVNQPFPNPKEFCILQSDVQSCAIASHGIDIRGATDMSKVIAHPCSAEGTTAA